MRQDFVEQIIESFGEPDDAQAAEAIRHACAEIGRALKGNIEWMRNDLAYKAPEQWPGVVESYFRMLEEDYCA